MSEDPTSVATRVATVRQRITEACRRAARDPAEVTLVGVAKFQPVERLRAALEAGVTVLGENRVQEAEAHRASLAAADDSGARAVAWHLIGPLQSNKARTAAALFDFIHSVDRLKIARLLDRELANRGRRVEALAEVNLAGEASKHGFPAEGLIETLAPLAAFEHLRIVGLMVIPPPDDAESSRRWFRRARSLRDELARRPEWNGFPGLLSMGMSADFEIAIEEGATHVRVGSALFGPRPDPP